MKKHERAMKRKCDGDRAWHEREKQNRGKERGKYFFPQYRNAVALPGSP